MGNPVIIAGDRLDLTDDTLWRTRDLFENHYKDPIFLCVDISDRVRRTFQDDWDMIDIPVHEIPVLGAQFCLNFFPPDDPRFDQVGYLCLEGDIVEFTPPTTIVITEG